MSLFSYLCLILNLVVSFYPCHPFPGQMDDFKFEVLDLGELTKLHIEHDNHGIGAGWMLDRCDVTNTTTGHVTSFPCQQWLDKKKGDKQVWRELYPATK